MVKEIIASDYRTLNEEIRSAGKDVKVTECIGQRFIGAGMRDKHISIEGIPGNALGAYLNGAAIDVFANAQDAVGDTMNEGSITIHGSVGDAVGYAMRGGRIMVKGDAGYRAGIHMKAYKDKVPVIIIGGRAGSFLAEYLAGGVIIVLGLDENERNIVGNFPCTGMHGGKVYLRGDVSAIRFPDQVTARPASAEDLADIKAHISAFCEAFGCDEDEILSVPFTVITPDSKNPYRQLYVPN